MSWDSGRLGLNDADFCPRQCRFRVFYGPFAIFAQPLQAFGRTHALAPINV
jgi:hypothetical protein